MAITTVGRSKELKKAKEKSIKLNPMGKTAQKEAAMKNWPKRKFKARAFIESVSDKNAPMKKPIAEYKSKISQINTNIMPPTILIVRYCRFKYALAPS